MSGRTSPGSSVGVTAAVVVAVVAGLGGGVVGSVLGNAAIAVGVSDVAVLARGAVNIAAVAGIPIVDVCLLLVILFFLSLIL